MSDKVYVPNTFPNPNDLVDKVMPVVSGAAYKIVTLITRHTLGWGGHNADMAWQVGIGELRRLTGLSHQAVISGIRELLKFSLILFKKGPRNSRTPNQYALNLDLTTGELVKNLDQSKKLSSLTSQIFRPVLVKKIDSLKINPIKHNKTGAGAPNGADAPSLWAVVNSFPKKNKPAGRLLADPEPEAFARWYESYPRHEARADGLKAWRKLKPDPHLAETIVSATLRYAAAKIDTEKKFIALPASWLNGRRWEDEVENPEPVTKRSFVNG